MATIHDLLKRIGDEALRAELEKEVRRLTGQKKFGLVFEEHLPEATPLHGMKIRVGMTVATRAQDGGALFTVLSLKDGVATCIPYGRARTPAAPHDPLRDAVDFPLDEIVAVAKFGDPIYPVLEPIDKIEHGGGDLWHALIQADNYHALQLLEYLYAGKVDCIYIDPPYNTGARDWKYNNDYVDKDDAYRHSKWLSMMKKRLVIAKRLLNPKDSVLIVTIDEKEYLHLGMLLEELFPAARIQMVDTVINRKGVSHKGKKGDKIEREEIVQFSRVSEYIYFVMIGKSSAVKTTCNMLDSQASDDSELATPEKVQWLSMLRRGTAARRRDKAKHFYPIFVNSQTATIDSVGDPIPLDVSRDTVVAPAGCVAVWPLRTDGSEGRWQLKKETFESFLKEGYARLGSYNSKQDRWAINYLNEGLREEILSGSIVVTGKDENGALILSRTNTKLVEPKSVWNQTLHNASEYGSTLINTIIGEKRFDFPKSLYAVHDAIRFFVANKPNALIVDFFAGSGTTLHAVNLLNAEDGGKRRCILVTNNEVSDAEEKDFRKRGLKPGDAEWEAKGIAQYVTWPRTTCSIKGVNVKGEALKGEYITAKGGALGDRALPMADGFKANCEFFKLAFVNKDAVSLGRQFKEILPLLWMRSGAKGVRPEVKRGEGDSAMMVLPQNGMAILLKENAFAEFEKKVADDPSIGYVYLVTDSEKNYRDMARSFEGKDCVQIYRHYLDNFRINKFATR